MKSSFWNRAIAFSLLALACCVPAAAQTLNLPADPAAWVNSGPITAEMLKGKAAFVYYYEEGCPTCRGKWPSLLEAAKKFEDKPIVFIGVNSGNSREAVMEYARDVKCNWPIIVDSNRQFEKDSGVNEISLQNIFQARIITADGKIGMGSYQDVEGTANRALAGAKWNLDPTGIPAPLIPVWRGLEFGIMNGVPAPLKAGLTSKDPAIKAGAEKLNSMVQTKIADEVKAAKEAYAAGEKWKSYKMVNSISVQYAGLDLPESVNKAKTALAADEAVKTELNAQRELDALKKRARTATPAAMRGLILKLKDLAEKSADTEAGAEAKQLLSQVPQN